MVRVAEGVNRLDEASRSFARVRRGGREVYCEASKWRQRESTRDGRSDDWFGGMLFCCPFTVLDADAPGATGRDAGPSGQAASHTTVQ